MGRRRRSSRPLRAAPLAVLVTALLLLLAGVEVEAAENGAVGANDGRLLKERGHIAPRRPVRREYDTHSYYVLELRDGSSFADASLAAEVLGAELVEQVGELKDHYLLRAPFSDRLSKRWTHDTAHEERDHVMELFYDSLLMQEQPPSQHGSGYLQSPSISNSGHEGLLSKLKSRNHLTGALPRSVVSLERQVIKKRVKRQLETAMGHPPANAVSDYIQRIVGRFGILDPLFPKQWHLANDQIQDNSINVTGVWAQGYTGKGIKVAIVDDGLDMKSLDLAPNFDAEGSWDYNDHTDLPEPRLSDDQHGTRCAGEIAAVKNDVCGVGVAYDAKIAGIRILSASISDADEASALNFGFQTNDIYSCSWGPPDDGRSMEAPSGIIQKSIINGVQNGRGGKGNIFVFASGNGGAVDDQCNFDGYTNSIYSITISAIDRKGLHPYYSEGCSANMVVTYSSGSGDNIHTTDVGERVCTDHHGGTSAAAPIAAGIYALVLSARPELTWRDMQHITLQSAVQVNPNDPDWQLTHAGRPYNHKYGYGKLDAYRIVEAAKKFKLVKPQSWLEIPVIKVDQPLTKEGYTSSVTISSSDLKSANFEALEHITVTVNAVHQRRGNMEVILESPNGIRSILARPRRFDDDPTGYPEWRFMSVKHWDENPVGEWKLTMLDKQTNGKNGTFVDWKMTFWGSVIDAALAKPYKLPGDDQILLPQPPHHKAPADTTTTTMTYISEGRTYTETRTETAAHDQTTKSYVRPTAHLPDDHASATGESDHPLDGLPSTTAKPVISFSSTISGSSTATAQQTGIAESDESDTDTKYLGPLKGLAGYDTWLYVAAGSVIIFLGAGVSFFLYRRRQRRGFQLLRGGDDGLPMSALERGGRRVMNASGGGATRAKALYDAFALSDSDEDPDIPASPGESRRALATSTYAAGGTGAGRSRSASRLDLPTTARERRVDDSYMSEFLEDEADDDDDHDGGSSRARSPAIRGPRHSTPTLEIRQQRYRDDDDPQQR